jgi:hypothetical protein
MRRITQLLLIIFLFGLFAEVAEAQRRGGGMRGGGMRGGGGFRGGGGSHMSRAGARSSFSRPSQRPSRANRPAQLPSHDRGRNINRDINRDVNRDINRDINANRDWNYRGDDYINRDWGCCDNHYHPVARAAVAATAAYATAAAIGSTVWTLPPYDCSVVVVDDLTYHQCGSSWYQPYFSGTSQAYIVVSPPQ